MRKISEQVVAGKSGLALELESGQHLRIADLEGRQVIDMALFNLGNLRHQYALRTPLQQWPLGNRLARQPGW